MTKEQVLEIMIDTVNEHNFNLMVESGMDNEKILENLAGQRPALEHMFGMIYAKLQYADVFK